MVDRVGTLSKAKKELRPGIHNRAGCPHMETPSFLSSWLSEAPDFSLTVLLFYLKLSTALDKGIMFGSYHYPISTKKEF